MAPNGDKSVVIACDGFGEELKATVVQHLKGKGVAVEDLGTDKFYLAAASVAKRVQQDPGSATGMLFCGTGMGVSIIANKFSGVYAAVVENEAAARNSRAINNANVVCLGGKLTSVEEALRISDAFLEQGFVTRPDTFMAKFWSPEVEGFLQASSAEIQEVEEQAHREQPCTEAQAPSVVVACDGFGEELKDVVVQHLKDKGVNVQDLGNDKFYQAAASVARLVQRDPSNATGMLFCGTGMGVSIVANKFKGVYAAVAENEAAARNSRHYNANVVCLGGKLTSEAEALRIADAFLEQRFVAQPDTFMGKFWSPEVEGFLKTSTAEIQEVEEETFGKTQVVQ